MDNYEKLGAFYLGKRYDTGTNALTDELTLYDSKDLSTHAVIIGMTGSGKTGLGIGLIEEAAMDRIPVIAIDPKGDLGNLLLTFPELKPDDFAPWVDPRQAADAGATVDDFAATTAMRWREGLAQWGQTPERIARLRDTVDMAIYTPGSNAGLPVSVLREFTAPPKELIDDADLYRQRVQNTATSILTLLDIDADPLTSREHILVANILDASWQAGRSLDLPGLITAIQSPSFDKIGVLDLESFYPSKDRFALAMRVNNLLASPGFGAWMDGAPLDMNTLMYTDTGKPRIAVMSIAHLGDRERMFFVTMLLNELIAWMRRQSGSSSLRAMLYMDEVFGYMPPVANPPTKELLLTLLKQARAFGLGLVLSTQNPVDLDYKGLSNTGTWFIGRLQTERDKARVREGLQTATTGEGVDPAQLEQIISGLGKRQFVLHNVHEERPVIFQTRWAMSYLAGPLTREQIGRLMQGRSEEGEAIAPAAPATAPVQASPPTSVVSSGDATTTRPPVPPEIPQWFAPVDTADTVVYAPRLAAIAHMRYDRARPPVSEKRSFGCVLDVSDGDPDWRDAEDLAMSLDDFDRKPAQGAQFAELPARLMQPKNFSGWERELKRWLRTEKPLVLWQSPHFKVYSEPGESERDFRIRLQQLGNEQRDLNVAKLRKGYERKLQTLQDKLMRAEQAIAREEEQLSSAKLDAVVTFGTAILGALLGRKTVSSTSVTRAGSAARKAGRTRDQAADVQRAEQRRAAVEEQLRELEAEFEADVDALDDAYDAQTEELTEVVVQAKASDIEIRTLGIGWFPAG